MAKVVSYRTFDFSKIEFGNVKVSKDGPRIVYLNYPIDNQFFQTAKSTVTFNPYETNFCVTMDPPMESKIKELEEHIIVNGVKNSAEWFGSVKTEEEVRDIFMPLLTQSKGDFPPFMRVNFSSECEYYNKDGELVDKGEIKRGVRVRLILKFIKLYAKEKDGKMTMRCNFSLTQARISDTVQKKKPISYAFVDSDEE